MKFCRIEPEVPGSLAGRTIVDRSSRPPKVRNLSIRFDGWAGGHLLEIFPCFFVTKHLKQVLQAQQLTGCRFERLRYRFGEYVPPRMRGVKFWRMLVDDRSVGTDFYADEMGYLMASERALAFLRQGWLEYCDVTPAAVPLSRDVPLLPNHITRDPELAAISLSVGAKG